MLLFVHAFDFEAAPLSRKPVNSEDVKLKALIDAKCRRSTRNVSERLDLLNSTAHDKVDRS